MGYHSVCVCVCVCLCCDIVCIGIITFPYQVLPAKDHAKLPVEPPEATARFVVEWQQRLMSTMMSQDEVSRKVCMKALKDARVARAAAFANLRSLGHALTLAGSGLQRFAPQEGEAPLAPCSSDEVRYFIAWEGPWPFEVPPEHLPHARKSIVKDKVSGKKRFELVEFQKCRPTISLSIDQGSKFWAATWFMSHYLHLRMATVFDPHHRCWNDIMDALGSCGLKHLVFEYMIVLNLAHGPWKSCEFWRQLQEGMDSYLRRADVHDDLFLLLYSRISHDMGQDQWCPRVQNQQKQDDHTPTIMLALLTASTYLSQAVHCLVCMLCVCLSPHSPCLCARTGWPTMAPRSTWRTPMQPWAPVVC